MLGSAWNAKSAAISSARETTSDMEALRSYFDTNGDGKLTSAFAQFKVLVTNADGSTIVKTLAQLGITEIILTEDSTKSELAYDQRLTDNRFLCPANTILAHQSTGGSLVRCE